MPTSSREPQLAAHAGKVVLRTGAALLLATAGLALAAHPPAAARPACTLVQLTDASGGVFLPSVSGDGAHVAVSTDGDESGGNPDGNFEIFLHDATDGTTTQITDTSGDEFSNEAALSTDATRIAFRSTADLTGGNTDGSNEIFLHDTTDGPDGTTTQITDSTSGNSFSPSTSADGTRIAFTSNADLTGDNPDGSNEIFLHDTTTGPDGTTSQLTDTSGSFSGEPAVSADGTRIAFRSTADLTGDNPDNNPDGEVFVLDTADGAITQLGETTGDSFSGEAAISADGTRVAFRSSGDLTGDKPDGGEAVYFATCGSPTSSFTDVGLAHPFFAEIEWLAEVEVTGGFPDGGYHPSAPVTRQAMAAFMFRLAGQPTFEVPAEPSFGDVSANHPFFAEIEWLAEVEVTGGFPDGGYHPAAPVTRQAMAAFLFRLAGQPPFTLPGTPSFDDVSAGHPFFNEIEWLAEVEITGGFPDGGYHPAAPVSRQAMAAFLFRLTAGPGINPNSDGP